MCLNMEGRHLVTPGLHAELGMQQIRSETKEAVSFTRAPMTVYSS